ncbi:MAG: Gfo/Idh/MocA family oxidoreductase [Bacillota bacterium]|nr:Gfo/Idh/MocA family oxidoreductase [Bacillota bacterium]
MIKVGLIGFGGMGGVHAQCYEALSDKVKVVAVADPVEEKRKEAVEKFACDTYESGEQLIENADVDMVDICTPTFLHTKFAVKAMENGINVFMEKPVCLNEQEAQLLLETESKTGCKVQIGQVIRFWNEYAWLKNTFESGVYGKLISGVFTRLSANPNWSWENWYNDPDRSGTIALDLHVHDVDFVRYLLGEPLDVSSRCTRNSQGVIEQIFSSYKYENAVVTTEGCWDFANSFPFTMGYRVKFEKATVVFDSTATPSLVVYQNSEDKIIPDVTSDFDKGENTGINISSLGAYYTEINYFVEALENDTPLLVAPLKEAIKSAELVWKEVELVGGKKI